MWLGVYNLSFIYMSVNPDQLTTNRAMYYALVVAAVSTGATLNIMGLIKYIAVIPNSTTRKKVEISAWIIQVIHWATVSSEPCNDAP